jgi:hypothetical protein
MCSTQADNNSRKLRLRCGYQFTWCALALRGPSPLAPIWTRREHTHVSNNCGRRNITEQRGVICRETTGWLYYYLMLLYLGPNTELLLSTFHHYIRLLLHIQSNANATGICFCCLEFSCSTESYKSGRAQRTFSTSCYNWLFRDNNLYSYTYILGARIA